MKEFNDLVAYVPTASRAEYEAALRELEALSFRRRSASALGGRIQVIVRGPFSEQGRADALRVLRSIPGSDSARSLHVGRRYTSRELESAPFLVAWLGVMPFIDGFPDFDITSACGTCRSGRRMPERYRLDKAQMKKQDVAATYHTNDLVCSDRARAAVEGAGLTGIRFVPGEPKSTRSSVVSLHVVDVPFVLPPMDRETSGLVRRMPCPSCDVTGWLHETEDRAAHVAYRDWPSDVPDVAMTYESLGEWSPGLVGGARLHVMSQRAYRVFRSLARRMYFEPVELDLS